MNPRPGFAPLLALLVALLWPAASGQPTVVVSIHPYFSLLSQIGGDRATVVRLLPPGASPHRFDPSPRDVALLTDADLIVVNGVLDVWLDDLIAASGSRAEVISIIEAIEGTPAGSERQDLHRRSVPECADPHLWLDPLLMAEVVPLLAERLSEIDPAGADLYGANALRLRGELIALDREMHALLDPVAGAPFVPFHDAWTCFAAHYGLNLLIEIEPFPGREPSPAYLSEALALIAGTGARAVFTERQLDRRSAEVVAESAAVALHILDPLGGGEGVESYQQMLRYNARVIAAALGNGTDR